MVKMDDGKRQKPIDLEAALSLKNRSSLSESQVLTILSDLRDRGIEIEPNIATGLVDAKKEIAEYYERCVYSENGTDHHVIYNNNVLSYFLKVSNI